MSFGFPAYFTQHLSREGAPAETLRSAARDALDALGWHVREERADQIVASTSLNIRSWGERVILSFPSDGSISVTSRCALPTQCVDWGKNKSNVQRFVAQFDRHV